MRIAIDASGSARTQGTGIAVYIRELTEALAALDRDDEFFLYYRFSRIRDRKLFLKPPGGNFSTVFPPLSLLKTRGVDVGHGPDGRMLNLGRVRIATVHDVFSLVSDRWADEKFRRKKAKRYAQIAKKAHLIVCDSKSTADDFARLFPGTKDRLRPVPLGVGGEFKPRAPGEVLQKLGLRKPYLLHVGNIARRKNLARLVKAFEKIAPSHEELCLVLAGRLSYGTEEVTDVINASAVKDRIILPGYVSREDLPALYGAAEVFVFPSLYEGFGLPALEAMACGTPVVASDCSSLPEVVGDAGLLVNPEREDEIAGAIDKLLCDGQLRRNLSEEGISRAKGFTWERTARETLEVYREAVI